MTEVISIQQANQFVNGRSGYECGFYAVSMLTSMAEVGQPPKLTPGQISDQAQQWYAAYNGDNSWQNQAGMSIEQLYKLLKQVGLHFQQINMNEETIRQALGMGLPVVVAVPEPSVLDIDINRNPYPWTPSGNHVIVITGVSGSAWVVRDSASIQPPNTLRPGPRRYDISRLQYVSATAVTPYWKDITQMPTVPAGWKDANSILTAPNGVAVRDGFRAYVLNTPWNPTNWPLQPELQLAQLEVANPALGGGAQQPFRMSVLEYTDAKGVFEMWQGQEVLALQHLVKDLRMQLANLPPTTDPIAFKTFLNQQIAAAQAYLATLS